MPVTRPRPAVFQPTSRYRLGARDEQARDAHNRQSRDWRRGLADAEFDAVDRALFLHALKVTGDPKGAAERLGITLGRVYGRMRWDAAFAAQVEAVLDELCAWIDGCGTIRGYRNGGRCTACRAAKAADREGRTNPDPR